MSVSRNRYGAYLWAVPETERNHEGPRGPETRLMMHPQLALFGSSHPHLQAGLMLAGLFALGLQVGKFIWTRARIKQHERREHLR